VQPVSSNNGSQRSSVLFAELRKRFETFLADRCKGKDIGKLRFVIE